MASQFEVITRDDLAKIYGVNQGYLGYLIREKKAPSPVMINGEIVFWKDEVDASLPKIQRLLEKRKKKVN